MDQPLIVKRKAPILSILSCRILYSSESLTTNSVSSCVSFGFSPSAKLINKPPDSRAIARLSKVELIVMLADGHLHDQLRYSSSSLRASSKSCRGAPMDEQVAGILRLSRAWGQLHFGPPDSNTGIDWASRPSPIACRLRGVQGRVGSGPLTARMEWVSHPRRLGSLIGLSHRPLCGCS